MAKTPRHIDEIVIHCSATRHSWMHDSSLSLKVDEIRNWHLARGFNDIGYHWIIDRDGSRMAGRSEHVVGAGVRGRNNNTIHVCLMGGFGSESTDTFAMHYTVAQNVALRQLIAEIKGRYTIKRISGHNEFANKSCPGFQVAHWINKKPEGAAAVSPNKRAFATAMTKAGPIGAVGGISVVSVGQAFEGWQGTSQIALAVVVCILGLAFIAYKIWGDEDA